MLEYLEAGSRLVWVVDPPTRTVTVYEPGGAARLVAGAARLDGGSVLPGLRIALTDVFRL